MPYRKTPLVAGQIYHVFNRSIAKELLFKKKYDYQHFLSIIRFYRYGKSTIRFSFYNRLSKDEKKEFDTKFLMPKNLTLRFFAYVIMPNHFHFLVRPLSDRALSDLMRYIQNSYSKYFNTKYQRTGSLFQSMFKAVRIESEEQLLHVSRYIHLNPVTAYLIKFDELENYPWSSFHYYLDRDENSFVDIDTVLSHFQSSEKYSQFVRNQVDYQRKLNQIKHLILEDP